MTGQAATAIKRMRSGRCNCRGNYTTVSARTLRSTGAGTFEYDTMQLADKSLLRNQTNVETCPTDTGCATRTDMDIRELERGVWLVGRRGFVDWAAPANTDLWAHTPPTPKASDFF